MRGGAGGRSPRVVCRREPPKPRDEMSRPQRNDPCPCGSGKKYKACCIGRDRATERTLRLVGGGSAPGEAPWNPAARAAELWEADVVPFPGGFRDDPDAAPALAMVGAAGLILHGDV